MDQTNILLAILTLTVSAVLVYGNVRQIPYQHAVRYMAIWLLVILVLALAYRTFGLSHLNTPYQPTQITIPKDSAAPKEVKDDGKTIGDQPGKTAPDSYTPPNE